MCKIIQKKLYYFRKILIYSGLHYNYQNNKLSKKPFFKKRLCLKGINGSNRICRNIVHTE